MLTVSSRPPTASRKCLSALSNTSYGPTYSGVRGGNVPPRRTYTWLACKSAAGEGPGSWDLDLLQLLEELGGRRLLSGQKFHRQRQRRPVHQLSRRNAAVFFLGGAQAQ